LVQKILLFNGMKVTLQSRKTAYIHSTELVWPRTFKVLSWCNRVEWFYRVGLCLLYCTVEYCTVLYDQVNWLYRVNKISIKWLWQLKVTLKVIKRRLLVFCWSCDEGHLKWDKKNCRASSLSLPSNESNLASQFQWSVNIFKVMAAMARYANNSYSTLMILYSRIIDNQRLPNSRIEGSLSNSISKKHSKNQ
jgi:hypothetical protein